MNKRVQRYCFILCVLILPFSLSPLISKGNLEEPLSVLDKENIFTIVYPQGDDSPLLDPFVANDELSLLILEGIYEGLFRVDNETGEAVKAIAEKVDMSSDGLIWTFYIKKSAKFSNGDSIKAKHFLISWLHLLESASPIAQKSYLVSLFDVVKGAKDYRLGNGKKEDVGIYEKSEYVVEVQLNNRAPYLPSLLTNVVFAAIHPDSFKNGKQSLTTSGAYTLQESSQNKILLAKNRYYHDSSSVKSDYIQILIKDELGAIESYLNKEAQWLLSYVPPQLLREKKDLHISQTYATGFFYFSAKSGPYSDSRVRKAISLITPWDEIRANSGQLFPSNTLIPMTTWADKKNSNDTTIQALSFLKEAGYSSFSSLPPLSMAIHRGAPIQETASHLATFWANTLLIPVIVDTVPLSLYTRYPRENPYDVSYITWVADFNDPFAFLPLFSSSSSYNIANYSNIEYDYLLEEALKSSDEVERKLYIEQAQNILLEDAIIFPIHSGFSLHIIDSSQVRGWYDNSINIHPLRSLERINRQQL